MSERFWNTLPCQKRTCCGDCRGDSRFRASVVAAGLASKPDFDCRVDLPIAPDRKPFRTYSTGGIGLDLL